MNGRVISRRRVLYTVGGGLVAAPAILKGLAAGASGSSPLFTLGVGSGDPGAHHVTLWTRLAPDPLNGGGMAPEPVPVTWAVATDPDMLRVIRRGRAVALPQNGHALRVLAGGLPANRWLYYRFEALGEASRIGRTRTFPALGDDDHEFDDDGHEFEEDDDGGDFDDGGQRARAARMRFALVSCQNYEQGFYTAFRDIVSQDLDFIVHVGDYIYEDGPTSTPIDPGRVHNGPEIFSVEDYRNRYALYRLDQDLQDAEARFPVVHTPDDHEVDNNVAGPIAEEGAPFQDEEFLQRRRNAFQVLNETMPYGPGVGLRDGGNRIQLYRRLDFGRLASLFVLDTRQFRTDQPAEDGFGSADPDSAALEPILGETLFDPAIESDAAEMLGGRQERWLKRGLRRSRATWNVLAQQVMVTRWNLVDTLFFSVPPAQQPFVEPLFSQVSDILNIDAWDGYGAARDRIFRFLDKRRPSNPVVLTGDIHSAWGANLLKDFDDPQSDILAAEFVCTAISSTFAALDPRPIDGIVKVGLPAKNSQIEFFNGLFRGYCLCDVDRKRWRTTYRRVGTPSDATDPNPLALVPMPGDTVEDDQVLEIAAGFNRRGSGQRLVTKGV